MASAALPCWDTATACSRYRAGGVTERSTAPRLPAVASTSGGVTGTEGFQKLRAPRGRERRAWRRSERRDKGWLVRCDVEGGYAYVGGGGCGSGRLCLDEEQQPVTPLLDSVCGPARLKSMSREEIAQLCDEVRSETMFRVPQRGERLDSSLGVVELTVALHHVFDAPEDRILWDVGRQAVPHKILTGRRRKIESAGHTFGLSGFTSRAESEYDPFGAGHSSTTISAGLGMAVGRDLKGRDNHVVTVIGDGAMSAGQAFEAMSHAGYLEPNMIVILNDSRPESAPSSTCGTLNRMQASTKLRELRAMAKSVTKQLSGPVHDIAAKVDEVARVLLTGSGASLFDELGLYYVGPVDGHNINHLVTVLNEVKAKSTDGPVLIHIVTEKGRGYQPPSRRHPQHDDRLHARRSSADATHVSLASGTSYSTHFARALIAEAEADSDIVAIHAAMGSATGLDMFTDRFPDRCFDVGVAEQHAVTFAAGLACEGLKPFCAIQSSYLQRAYDQVIHDVDLQRLPVRFAIDRAGLVGADGPTHAGTFDVTYMACLPSMIVMAPSDEAELFRMVATAAAIDDRPSCFRYPRGNGVGVEVPADKKGVPLEAVGRGRILVEGTDVALLGYGSMVQNCLAAQALLAERHGISVTVADARFCKPLDRALIRQLARGHQAHFTVEEGAIGGFGSHVAQFMALDGLLDGNLKWRPLVLPDYYIGHGSHEDQLAQAGLTVSHIAASVLTILGKKREALHIF